MVGRRSVSFWGVKQTALVSGFELAVSFREGKRLRAGRIPAHPDPDYLAYLDSLYTPLEGAWVGGSKLPSSEFHFLKFQEFQET